MQRLKLPSHLAILGAALLLGSCSSSSKKSGSAGELDNGIFHYGCADAGADVACESTGDPDYSNGIAVGARFLMDYVPKGNNTEGTVVPSVPSRISQDAEQFTIEMAGFTALLALSSSGEVLDIKHVQGKDVDAIKVRRAGSLEIDDLLMDLDATEQVWSVPFDAQGDPLAGTLPFVWSTDDDTIVRLNSAAENYQVELLAVGVGTTNIHVMSGELVATIPVTVGDGTGTGTTGTGGSDTSTGSGSDTGTGGSDTGTGTGSTGGAT